MTLEEEIEHLKAVAAGSQQALVSIVGALIETHPDKVLLKRSMDWQLESAQKMLKDKNYPEASMKAFHAMEERLRYSLTTVTPPQN